MSGENSNGGFGEISSGSYSGGAFSVVLLLAGLVIANQIIRLQERESDLRLINGNLLRVFEGTPLGVLVIDDRDIVLTCNRNFEDLSGLMRHQVVGLDLIRAILPDVVTRGYAADIARVFDELRNGRRESFSGQMIARNASGRLVRIGVTLGSIQGNDGTAQIVAFVRDAGHIARNARQLRRQRIAAERLAETRAAFTSTMSHAMRTPLHGVIAAIDLLQHRNMGTDAATELLEIARTSARDALNEVEDVLEVSRLDTTSAAEDMAEFSPDDPVRDLIGMAMPIVRKKGLRLQATVLPGADGRWRGKVRSLETAIKNLVNNAIKYTDSGQVDVFVNVAPGEDSAFVLLCEVRDTGPGISLADQKRIFADFERAGAQDKPGTGLGLGIFARAVRAMNGRYGLDSKPGEGSLFWFEVPVQPVAQFGQSLVEKGAGPILHRDRPARILVVDDNEINRQLMRRMLDVLGLSCDLAVDGEDAVRQAAATGYDVILMDLRMPGLDGLAATRLIRAGSGPSRRAAIAAVTGNLPGHHLPEMQTLAMERPLTKPVTLADLGRFMADIGLTPDMAEPMPQTSPRALPSSIEAEVWADLVSIGDADWLAGCVDRFLTDLGDLVAAPDKLDADRVHRVAGGAAALGLAEVFLTLKMMETGLRSGAATTDPTALSSLDIPQVAVDLRRALKVSFPQTPFPDHDRKA